MERLWGSRWFGVPACSVGYRNTFWTVILVLGWSPLDRKFSCVTGNFGLKNNLTNRMNPRQYAVARYKKWVNLKLPKHITQRKEVKKWKLN